MFPKKLALSLALFIVPSFIHLVADSSLRLEYTISYKSTRSQPEITVSISGVSQNTLDLIVSPMVSFDMERRGDADTWLVDEIHAYAPDGTELSVTGPETVSVPYTLLPLKPHYHLYHVHTSGNDHFTLRYRATVPIVVGYLETLLLRPYQHQQIGATMLRFDIPQGWQVVTVVTPRADAQFDLGMLDSMYGDNLNPAFNFVPMAFAVGSTKDITEIPTSCGRLIFAYPDMYPTYDSRAVFEQQVELGKRFFEFLCREVGPLEPDRTFIANNNWQEDWMPQTYQPGLYSNFWQHNRTMDWSTGLPSLDFSSWRFGTFMIGNTMVDEPDVTYYHLPHALTRAWFKGSTYFVLSPSQADWFVRGGASGYFQEKMLYEAFGPIKVYQRFQETYEFYKQQYLGTPQDRPLMSSGDKFIGYFKSELWAFYANQRILEATHGERDLGDAIRWLYAKFGGTGKAYTYQDVQMAINITANADLSDLIQVYAYTTAPLPLDPYFQDDDNDGVPNGLERELGFDPQNPDTNGDGISDAVAANRMYAPIGLSGWELPTPTATALPTSTSTALPTSTTTASPNPIATASPTSALEVSQPQGNPLWLWGMLLISISMNAVLLFFHFRRKK